jgi:hypothetical protein
VERSLTDELLIDINTKLKEANEHLEQIKLALWWILGMALALVLKSCA